VDIRTFQKFSAFTIAQRELVEKLLINPCYNFVNRIFDQAVALKKAAKKFERVDK
jgi:hypothetical protein